jgi:hypothetical protein
MSQNEDVDMSDYDEEASLAFARKLQDEYDRLAFVASSAGSANNDSKVSNLLSGDYQSDAHSLSATPSKGKQPMTDEEYARHLAGERDDYQSAPVSDQEFARQLQLQEDPNFNFSSPFPPTPQSRSPNDNSRKDPFSVPSTLPYLLRPPSPPITPSQFSTSPFQSIIVHQL